MLTTMTTSMMGEPASPLAELRRCCFLCCLRCCLGCCCLRDCIVQLLLLLTYTRLPQSVRRGVAVEPLPRRFASHLFDALKLPQVLWRVNAALWQPPRLPLCLRRHPLAGTRAVGAGAVGTGAVGVGVRPGEAHAEEAHRVGIQSELSECASQWSAMLNQASEVSSGVGLAWDRTFEFRT